MSWSCTACTWINAKEIAPVCECCSTPRLGWSPNPARSPHDGLGKRSGPAKASGGALVAVDIDDNDSGDDDACDDADAVLRVHAASLASRFSAAVVGTARCVVCRLCGKRQSTAALMAAHMQVAHLATRACLADVSSLERLAAERETNGEAGRDLESAVAEATAANVAAVMAATAADEASTLSRATGKSRGRTKGKGKARVTKQHRQSPLRRRSRAGGGGDYGAGLGDDDDDSDNVDDDVGDDEDEEGAVLELGSDDDVKNEATGSGGGGGGGWAGPSEHGEPLVRCVPWRAAAEVGAKRRREVRSDDGASSTSEDGASLNLNISPGRAHLLSVSAAGSVIQRGRVSPALITTAELV